MKFHWDKSFDKFLNSLNSTEKAKLLADKTFLRGIYFHIENNQYFITHGFKKKNNKTPKKEIDKAKKIRQKKLRG